MCTDNDSWCAGLAFAVMTPQAALAIAHGWHYPAPHDFYDMEADPDDLHEFTTPELWPAVFLQARRDDELVGFVSGSPDAEGCEVALGMRPDLVGGGRGEGFLRRGLLELADRLPATHQWRLSVAEFNRRAITVYGRAGFAVVRRVQQETNGGVHPFVQMQLSASRADLVRGLLRSGGSSVRSLLLSRAGDPDVTIRAVLAEDLVLPGEPDLATLDTLAALTEDVDERVRNWATFSLATLVDADTPEVRAALRCRLDDPDGDVAAEAALGLARRHDRAVGPWLRACLDPSRPAVGRLVVVAAGLSGDAGLLPLLRRLREDVPDDHDEWDQDLAEAIRRLEAGSGRGGPPVA